MLSAAGVSLVFYEFGAADIGGFLFSSPCANKIIGGGVSKSEFKTSVTPTVIGSPLGISLSTDANGTPVPINYNNAPIRLDEGKGINFVPAVADQAVTVYLEITEE